MRNRSPGNAQRRDERNLYPKIAGSIVTLREFVVMAG
jgi:hypothetical protein